MNGKRVTCRHKHTTAVVDGHHLMDDVFGRHVVHLDVVEKGLQIGVSYGYRARRLTASPQPLTDSTEPETV